MVFDFLSIGAWSVAGVLALCKKEVTKFEYALCWSVLLVNLIVRAVTG